MRSRGNRRVQFMTSTLPTTSTSPGKRGVQKKFLRPQANAYCGRGRHAATHAAKRGAAGHSRNSFRRKWRRASRLQTRLGAPLQFALPSTLAVSLYPLCARPTFAGGQPGHLLFVFLGRCPADTLRQCCEKRSQRVRGIRRAARPPQRAEALAAGRYRRARVQIMARPTLLVLRGQCLPVPAERTSSDPASSVPEKERLPGSEGGPLRRPSPFFGETAHGRRAIGARRQSRQRRRRRSHRACARQPDTNAADDPVHARRVRRRRQRMRKNQSTESLGCADRSE